MPLTAYTIPSSIPAPTTPTSPFHPHSRHNSYRSHGLNMTQTEGGSTTQTTSSAYPFPTGQPNSILQPQPVSSQSTARQHFSYFEPAIGGSNGDGVNNGGGGGAGGGYGNHASGSMPTGLPSRPQSPSYFRSTIAEVQSVLYGGQDKEEIRELVREVYDGSATFENPITLAKGPDNIAEMFCLFGLVPGTMWSEVGDICESQSYDGNRLVVMTHTLHVSLVPSLSSDPRVAALRNAQEGGNHPRGMGLAGSSSFSNLRSSQSFSSAMSGNPFFGMSGNPDGGSFSGNPQGGGGPFNKTTHPASLHHPGPIRTLLSLLSPSSVAEAVTTLHLRLHTRLVFNENGKISYHEDTWGLKETIEGFLPLFGHLYALNRQGICYLAGWASRSFLFRKKDNGGAGGEEENGLGGTSMFQSQIGGGGGGGGGGSSSNMLHHSSFNTAGALAAALEDGAKSPFGLHSPVAMKRGLSGEMNGNYGNGGGGGVAIELGSKRFSNGLGLVSSPSNTFSSNRRRPANHLVIDSDEEDHDVDGDDDGDSERRVSTMTEVDSNEGGN